MLQNLGLVLLTAAEPKTGQSQTGMGGLEGVEEEKEEEEAGGSTIVCNEASPFSCDETVNELLPKEEGGLFKPEGLTQHWQEFSQDGQEFTQHFNGRVPVCSAQPRCALAEAEAAGVCSPLGVRHREGAGP